MLLNESVEFLTSVCRLRKEMFTELYGRVPEA